MFDFPFIPESASTISGQVDLLFYALTALSILFTFGVTVFIIFFAIRYQRGAQVNRANPPHEDTRIELTWTIIPFFLALAIFGWGTSIFFTNSNPPADAMEIYVIGKQWMWKTQHPNGKSEINALHVPVNQPVKLIMTSQDVIHSFYIPAFRVKKDVLPGRYTTLWFEATKTGEYHLFCAEYCGAEHAKMIGTVYVLDEAEYQRWLGGAVAASGGQTMASAGEALFQQQGCISCHANEDGGRGPSLVGIFGETQELASGETITVDEAYLRESILNPQAKIVAGYSPIMPAYDGILSEEEVLQLVDYIKSLQ